MPSPSSLPLNLSYPFACPSSYHHRALDWPSWGWTGASRWQASWISILGSPCCGLLLLPPPRPGFFGRGLVGGLGNLLLFSTVWAFASLLPLPFLVCCLHGKGACRGRGGWSGHHWHGWGQTPSIGSQWGQQVRGLFFKSCAFRDVFCLLVGVDLRGF